RGSIPTAPAAEEVRPRAEAPPRRIPNPPTPPPAAWPRTAPEAAARAAAAPPNPDSPRGRRNHHPAPAPTPAATAPTRGGTANPGGVGGRPLADAHPRSPARRPPQQQALSSDKSQTLSRAIGVCTTPR